jgi:hypothetical protein
VALVELAEENHDTLATSMEIQDRISPGTPFIDRDPVVEARREICDRASWESWSVGSMVSRPEEAALAVVHEKRFEGAGRRGRLRRYYVSEARLDMDAPIRPGPQVGGGIKSSIASVLSHVRIWPGHLKLRREGTTVAASCGPVEKRLSPGETAVLADSSIEAEVIQEIVDDGSGIGKPSRKGIRELSLGRHQFRTRLILRYVGLRQRIVIR